MKLAYVIAYVPDVAAAVGFWERAFGIGARMVHESGTYAELDTGATTLAFVAEDQIADQGLRFTRNRPTADAPGIELGLAVDDVPAAWARALGAGATPASPPAVKPWGQTVAYVRDPDGLLVELCTPMG